MNYKKWLYVIGVLIFFKDGRCVHLPDATCQAMRYKNILCFYKTKGSLFEDVPPIACFSFYIM